MKKPRDIDIGIRTFRFRFGRAEMEGAARVVVALMRRDNEWRSFTRGELLEFARHLGDEDKRALGIEQAHLDSRVVCRHGRVTFPEWDAHCVDELVEYDWLTVSGETLSLTDAFVARVSGVT